MQTSVHCEDKRVYQKPELVVIDLVADEVLTTGCKIDGGNGQWGGLCEGCGEFGT